MSGLIFDIGLHTGRDAKFYLDKGFDVVGLEANPVLCAAVRQTLATEIDNGRLTIVERALWERAGETVTFYVNAEKDDWGSLYQGVAEKGVSASSPITVQTVTLAELFDRHGVPYYVKCDIENGDAIFVRQLLRDARRPKFVSLEATAISDIACLEACGYDRFQLVNQMFHQFHSVPPLPAREGAFAETTLDGHMSGLFGRELEPDRWVSIDAIAERWMSWDRLRRMDERLGVGWLDVHATHASTLAGE